ncbi:putative Acyl-ACP thioesterase [uncultured spirochete]|jgi:medium-chain acyl-[acyl-carrier-protein] hydrolase|uniref:Putative Acyl-ACP thioesterase n=1 Tax=uncultured spirochete TaxID=156406 RepID=A0A3P3XQS2_9SPIR|nr:putative Acyl-ACP thioesterase [uncultured spirochete]
MIKPLEIQYVIRGYDCGYGGPLKPFALANFFQEAAGAHASQLGIGMEDMWASGLTWMLSRIDIRIDSMPQAGQTVVARTWPVGTRKLFALRCLELVDGHGTKYAGAMYEYIVVDMKTRRVMRPERTLPLDLSTDYPWPFDDLAPGIDDPSFKALSQHIASEGGATEGIPADEKTDNVVAGGFRQSFSIESRTRHIDQNGHVNNAHFINWLCDAAPLREGQRFSRIKVDFVHEIMKGENVRAWAGELASSPEDSEKLTDSVTEYPRETAWLTALTVERSLAARGSLKIAPAED